MTVRKRINMARFICSRCGTQINKPKRKSRSNLGCIVMGLLFLVTLPTIIIPIIIVIVDYMWYRSSIKNMCCPCCEGSECVIPINSPMGQKLMRDFSASKSTAVSSSKNFPQKGKEEIVYDSKTHQYVKVQQ